MARRQALARSMAGRDGARPQLAKRGMELDWYMQVMIANGAEHLSKFRHRGELPARGDACRLNDWRLRLSSSAISAIPTNDARGGARNIMRRACADGTADLQAGGSMTRRSQVYEARIIEPVVRAWRRHDQCRGRRPRVRRSGAPWAGRHGTRAKARPAPTSSLPSRKACTRPTRTAQDHRRQAPNTCTTHFCAADSEGNMVALTQTLMSLFGSCVMLPRPASPEHGMVSTPSNRPLDRAQAAAGICPWSWPRTASRGSASSASGGRRIVPAVTQLSLIDRPWPRYRDGIPSAAHRRLGRGPDPRQPRAARRGEKGDRRQAADRRSRQPGVAARICQPILYRARSATGELTGMNG